MAPLTEKNHSSVVVDNHLPRQSSEEELEKRSKIVKKTPAATEMVAAAKPLIYFEKLDPSPPPRTPSKNIAERKPSAAKENATKNTTELEEETELEGETNKSEVRKKEALFSGIVRD